MEQIQQLLYLANTEPSPFSERHRLQVAKVLGDNGYLSWAGQVLEDLDTERLKSEEFRDFTIQYAQVLLEDKQAQKTLNLLRDPLLARLFPGLATEDQALIYLMRARAHALLAQPMEVFNTLLQLDPLLPGRKQRDNRKAIWEILMNASPEELRRHADTLPRVLAEVGGGWLELALLVREPGRDPGQRLTVFGRWQNHPALQNPPPEVQLLRRAPARSPNRIALLLPLTGPLGDAGDAVRDGVIAARYAARARGETVPILEIFDTGREEVQPLYLQAVERGAQWVIGPLRPEKLQELARVRLSVPVLALNRLESGGTSNLYQFSLHAEDELQQLGAAAERRGWRNALLLRPEDDWSLKTADRFVEIWTAGGGTLSGEGVYTSERNISRVVRNALRLNQSVVRARLLENRLKMQLQTESRPRRDVDVVVLLADAETARLLRPVLQFHRAEDLPVLSISRIYDGSMDRKKNADLDGIVFTETPWLLERGELHQAMEAAQQPDFTRMHAIGVTAWQLLPWLKTLGAEKQTSLYSASGRLSVDRRGRIRRRLPWAVVDKGVARYAPGYFVSAEEK